MNPRTTRINRSLKLQSSTYPLWFYVVPGLIYGIFLAVPTLASFYFSFTRWDLFEATWIGLDNFKAFLSEQALVTGLRNTLIYAVLTTALKVVLGMALAILLTSRIVARGYLRSAIFFPTLLSTIGVGVTFTVLMNPTRGLINQVIGLTGVEGPGWLSDPALALYSVSLVDVWQGVGVATVILIAGLVAIPEEYFSAARVDGANEVAVIRYIILPLARPATVTVIILALIGGLRSFSLIWVMTGGGPGFASEVLSSSIYKQYGFGFYGLSAAGSVVLFFLIMGIALPLNRWLNRGQEPLT